MSGKIKTAGNRLLAQVGKWRLLRLGTVTLLVWSAFVPVFNILFDFNLYNLAPEAKALVGEVNTNLSAKFSYNSEKKTWMFNKDGLAMQAESLAAAQGTSTSEVGGALAQLRQQTGGGGKADSTLYSVKLPSQLSDGFTYYDNVTNLSFKLIPEDKSYQGKKWNDRVVYPMANGMKAVYTAKTNGLKEDIILTKPVGNEVSFSYTLDLPEELEAHLTDDGGLGIYSADAALYAASAGTAEDQAKIVDARKTATKNHLVFALPKPIIVDAKGVQKTGSFSIAGDTLIVRAWGLDKLSYPLTVDPSVVIDSSSDFTTGNNEGGIDFSTSGQMNGMKLTGASVGTWNTATSLGYQSEKNVSVVHNGYIYAGGGENNYTPAEHNELYYATVNASTGAIGSWTAATNLPTPGSNNDRATLMPYNGYMYYVSSYATGGSTSTMRFYSAPINSNGSLGDWTEIAASGPTGDGAFGSRALIYNGYMYISGGGTGINDSGNCSGASNCRTDVYYAPIRANGTIGSWTATSSFATGRAGHGFVAYEGRLYVTGGVLSGAGFTNQVYVASVNSNGSLSSWAATTVLAEAQGDHISYVYNGYLYVLGGRSGTGTAVRYAQISANGSVGSWSTTTVLPVQRSYIGSNTAAANGYLYIVNGRNSGGTVDLDSVIYAKVDTPGTTNAWTTSGNNIGTSVALNCTVAYNGYLYNIGGSTSDSPSNNVTTVRYAAVAADGTVGTWATATALPEARGSAGCAVYNGRLYVIGGYTGTGTASNTTRYIAINADGTLAASWTNGTNMTAQMVNATGFTYTTPDGTTRLYAAGMYSGTSARVDMTTINLSTGALGTWTTANATNPNGNTGIIKFAVVGKYVYAFGFQPTSTTDSADVRYATIASDGTVGTWTTTTSQPGAKSWISATTVNGCIYSVGGWNSVSSVSVNSVYYACPNADGTISNWYTAPSLALGTEDMGVTTFNGHIYAVGGYTTAVVNTVKYAKVNNGGSGKAGTWSSSATSSPAGSAGASMEVNGNYLYLTGGADGSTQRDWSSYAQLNSDGTVGSYTSGPTMTTPRAYHGMATYNGYIYAIGGSTTGWNPVATVEYAQIQSNGSIGSWSTTTSLPEVRYSAKAVAYGGYMYVVGGGNSSAIQNTVLYAPINSNGTLGSWSSTSTFTNARVNLGAFAYGGYMYVSGGYTGISAGTYYRDMQYAPINSNGTLGSWSYTSAPDAAPRATHYVSAYNGFVYSGGGSATVDSTNVAFSDMSRAPILSGGQIGAWETTTSMGTGTFSGAATIAAGRLYVYGGRNAGGNTSNMQYTPLDSVAHVARYSKLFNLGSNMSQANVGYNGQLGAGGSVTFATAGSDGVFGTYGSGTVGSLSDPGGTCVTEGVAETAYVHARVVIDDSQLATFAGTGSNNLTDLTVYYGNPLRAPTQNRLHGGKWFNNGTLQQLDTCGT